MIFENGKIIIESGGKKRDITKMVSQAISLIDGKMFDGRFVVELKDLTAKRKKGYSVTIFSRGERGGMKKLQTFGRPVSEEEFLSYVDDDSELVYFAESSCDGDPEEVCWYYNARNKRMSKKCKCVIN